MNSRSYNIGMVGCGKMGGALLGSWLNTGLINSAYIVDPNGLPAAFKNKDNIKHLSAGDLIKKKMDILIIAVKPQILDQVCKNIHIDNDTGTVILSIAAGKSLKSLADVFGKNQRIIRVMPNTPAAIGKGVNVCIANDCTSNDDKAIASELLCASGTVEWIKDESLMDAVTAVSGSGPAYVFYMIEVLQKAAIRAGLDTHTAEALARQTVIGSAALAEYEKDLSACNLRENVTSPNGTTQAALDVLMDGRMEEIFIEAVNAAKKRSIVLNT